MAVTVEPVVTESITALENGSVTITTAELLAADGGTDSGSLSVSNVTATGGALVNNGNGTWTFTPTANSTTAGNISYTITDSTSGATTNANMTVNVAAVHAEALNVLENGSVTITAAELLASDGDNSNLAILNPTTSNITATNGVISNIQTDGNGHLVSFTFTPTAGSTAAANISYTVTDTASGATAPSSMAVTVEPVVTESITALENGSVTITTAELLAADGGTDSGSLSVSSVTATGGALVNNGNGTWTFTPTANSTTAGNISYTITDSTSGATTNANMTVNVAAVHAEALNVLENGSVTITAAELLASDGDNSNLAILNPTTSNINCY